VPPTGTCPGYNEPGWRLLEISRVVEGDLLFSVAGSRGRPRPHLLVPLLLYRELAPGIVRHAPHGGQHALRLLYQSVALQSDHSRAKGSCAASRPPQSPALRFVQSVALQVTTLAPRAHARPRGRFSVRRAPASARPAPRGEEVQETRRHLFSGEGRMRGTPGPGRSTPAPRALFIRAPSNMHSHGGILSLSQWLRTVPPRPPGGPAPQAARAHP
jgi:hypothetical protein